MNRHHHNTDITRPRRDGRRRERRRRVTTGLLYGLVVTAATIAAGSAPAGAHASIQLYRSEPGASAGGRSLAPVPACLLPQPGDGS